MKRLITTFVILIVIIGAAFFAVTYGGGKNTPEISSNADLLGKLLDAEVKGGVMNLTSDDINSAATLLIGKEFTKSGITLRGLYVQNKNGILTLYVPSRVKGINVLLSSRVDVKYDNNKLILVPEDYKLGLVPIPKGIVMGKLKGYSSGNIKISDSNIEVSKSLFPVPIKSIALKNDSVEVKVEKQPEFQWILKQMIEAEKKNPSKNTDLTNKSGKSTSNKSSNKGNGSEKKGNASNSQNSPSSAQKRVSILSAASGQLQAAISSCKTSKEKMVVKEVQLTILKMIENPSYSYQSDIGTLSSLFNKLSSQEKERVKAAILSHVDTKSLMKISNQSN